MAEFEGYCCEACFDNDEISAFIQENGEVGTCPYCKSEDVFVCDTKRVGDFIKEGLCRAYEVVDYLWIKEDLCRPLSVYDILHDDLCIFSEQLLEQDEQHITLLEDLMDPQLSDHEIQQGAMEDLEFQEIFYDNFIRQRDFFDTGEYEAHSAWDQFKYICQHFNRFFDVPAASDKDHPRPRKLLLDKLMNVFLQVEKTEKDIALYRIRIHNLPDENTQDCLNSLDAESEIGPAPYKAVKHNRMSPAGIPYIYLANSFKTCAKETRVHDGDYVLLGRFSIKQPLKLLDLTTKSIEEQNFDPGSIFSEAYNPDMIWMKDFLIPFAREISKPILEEESNLDYVPTQLMAEYIRASGYDGIIFSSSVNPTGKNFVLFYGPIKTPEHPGFNEGDPYVLHPYTDVLKLEELTYTQVSLAPAMGSRITYTPSPDKVICKDKENILTMV